MDKSNVGFVVVGCGHIGKRHAALIQRNPEAQLVAIVDIDPAKEAMVKEEFKVPFFNSLDDLLHSDLKFDVINIATPNHLHAIQSVQALRHGYHVVCEKPMALSRKECEEMIQTSTETGKLVFGVMQNRYSPPSVWLKEIVDSGRLGQIFMVQIGCYWNRDSRYYHPTGWKGKKRFDGGTLFTQFSHFVDIMYWLFGDVKNINSTLRDFNHQELTDFEDSGVITFEFEQGGMGTFAYSTAVWDKNLESSMTIIAENGSLKVSGQYMDEVEYCHVKGYEMPELKPTNPANDYGHFKGSAANHGYVIENVINKLRNKEEVTTNAREGMMVVDIIERMYRSTANQFVASE